MKYGVKVKVGDLVRKISAWDPSCSDGYGTGIILKIEDKVAHIHWQTGQTYEHYMWELVKI
tara:strand:- start:772 stop:954 length:183 start_codon:yes stop_codon:yes gene_type:complete